VAVVSLALVSGGRRWQIIAIVVGFSAVSKWCSQSLVVNV
jgi:hypothetical protein